MESTFKITLPIEQSIREGKWYIKGTAAGLGPDRENQRLTPRAIENLAKRINENPVPFRDWHSKNSILGDDIGMVTSAWITEDFSLGVEVELDQKHPTAKYIWDKLDDGKQFGMSIGGKSNDFKVIIENNIPIIEINDVEVDEVSGTTKPMWTPSFGTVIRKAIDETIAQGDRSTMDVETTSAVVTTAEETNEESSLTPRTDATLTVEKAVTTDTAKDAKKLAALVKSYKQTGALLQELGLLVDEENTDSSETVAPTDQLELVKSALEEITAPLKIEIEALKGMIPERDRPPLVVSKSAEQEWSEFIAPLSTYDRLRAALAVQTKDMK